jgi:hypothetical protein
MMSFQFESWRAIRPKPATNALETDSCVPQEAAQRLFVILNTTQLVSMWSCRLSNVSERDEVLNPWHCKRGWYIHVICASVM